MENIWFVYFEGRVHGPFSRESIEADIERGRWSRESTQLWCKGQKMWIPVSRWYENFETVITGATEPQLEQPAIWHVERAGIHTGPLTKTGLIEVVKKLKNIGSVRLWRAGLHHWKNLFEFQDLLQEMGISRRAHERFPIAGHITFKKNKSFEDKDLVSLSTGGLGIRDATELVVNENLMISMYATAIDRPIQATVKVKYIDDKGFAGLEFQALHASSKTAILNYTEHFKSDRNFDKTVLLKRAS